MFMRMKPNMTYMDTDIAMENPPKKRMAELAWFWK